MSLFKNRLNRQNPVASMDELEEEMLFRLMEDNVFPLHIFPTELKSFIEILTQKGLDRGFIGLSILTAFGSAIGNRFVSTTPDGFPVKSIFWSVFVGTSSGGKSITQNLVYKPLKDIDAKMIAESENDNNLNKRLVVGKGTHESLVKEILPDNPRGILRFEDEIRGWLESIGMYSKKRGAEEADYLSMWDGSRLETNRSKRQTFYIEKPYICLTGSTQTVFLKSFFEESMLLSGFTYRFLFVIPNKDEILSSKKVLVSTEARAAFDAAIEKIVRKEQCEYQIQLNDADEIWAIFSSFEAPFIAKANANGRKTKEVDGVEKSIFSGFFGKLRVYFWRFCLLMCVIENIFTQPDEPQKWKITTHHAQAAQELCNYFLETARAAIMTHEQTSQIPFEAMQLAAYMRTGVSSRKIAEMFESPTGEKYDHSTIARKIKRYSVLFPSIFGGKSGK